MSDEDRVRVVRTHDQAKLPTRAYPDDAGLDLYYAGESPLVVPPDEVTHVPSRIAMQLPDGYWGFMIGRSSTFQRGILVHSTVIDPGWRGELFANIRNVSGKQIEIQPGERIAQIVPLPLAPRWRVEEDDKLDESERNTNGFGSSGR